MSIVFAASTPQHIGTGAGVKTFSHTFSGKGACVLITSQQALGPVSAVSVGGVALTKVADGPNFTPPRYGAIWAKDSGIGTGSLTVSITVVSSEVLQYAVAVDVTSTIGDPLIGDAVGDAAASGSTFESVTSPTLDARGIGVTCATAGATGVPSGHTAISIATPHQDHGFITKDATTVGAQTVGFTGNSIHGGAVMLWEELPVDAVAEPTRIGEESGFQAGIEVAASEDAWVFASRMPAEETGFREGVIVRAEGPRQVALVGRMLETAEMTEGGVEGYSLTFHEHTKPDWQPGGAGSLDDLDDVDAPSPEEGDVLVWDDAAGEWVNAPPTPSAIGSTWTYSTNTAAPPTAGQIRSTGAATIGAAGTIWLHHVDDANYDWSSLQIEAGDELIIRNRVGQGARMGQFNIDAVADTVPGPTGYWTLDVTKVGEAVGTLTKNYPVSVLVVRRGGAGGGGSGNVVGVWDDADPGTPAQDESLWYDTDEEPSAAGVISSLPSARARRTSGDVSMNSTTWANFDTGLDLVIAAQAGDVLLVDVSGHYNSEAVGGILDAATIVSGSPVNYISGGAGGASNRGVLGWYGPGASASVGAAIQYVVQSGDISGGNVTLRLRYRTTSASVKTMNATSDIPFQWSVVNLRSLAQYMSEPSGTVFPVSPIPNQKFYRTDIRGGMLFRYDGTRWLSENEYSVRHESWPTIAADINAPAAIPHDYPIYITAVDALLYIGVAATWVFSLQQARWDESSYPTIWTRSIAGNTGARWYGYTDAVGAVLDATGGNSGANPTGLWWVIDEQTGTSTVYYSLVARYRLIAT
jgi:hypothetical protein